MRTTRIIEQRKIEHREKTLAKLQAKIDNITLSKLPTIIGKFFPISLIIKRGII